MEFDKELRGLIAKHKVSEEELKDWLEVNNYKVVVVNNATVALIDENGKEVLT